VARPEKHRPTTLEEAVAELKRDPAHPVRLVVDGIEIELRRPPESGVIPGAVDQSNLGDRIAAIGPWQGESTDELVEILRRGGDDSARKLPDLL
jgi:hypothetical protein